VSVHDYDGEKNMSDNAVSLNVSVTFRHTDSTDALKQYATEKISNCIKKYVKSPTDVKIVLEVDKRDHIAEVNLHSQRFDLASKAAASDLYAAIDKLVDTVVAQLRKQKDKKTDHHRSAA
jgi:putative sigma-54 modulation protein